MFPEDVAQKARKPNLICKTEPNNSAVSGAARNLRLAARAAVGHIRPQRSCGRVAEGGGLLNRYRLVKAYRGFESLRLRHSTNLKI
jgi:hypothetical protein